MNLKQITKEDQIIQAAAALAQAKLTAIKNLQDDTNWRFAKDDMKTSINNAVSLEKVEEEKVKALTDMATAAAAAAAKKAADEAAAEKKLALEAAAAYKPKEPFWKKMKMKN